MARKSEMVTALINRTGGIPYSLTVPNLPTWDRMTEFEFNTMMEEGCNQTKTGEGLSVDEAFAKICDDI